MLLPVWGSVADKPCYCVTAVAPPLLYYRLPIHPKHSQAAHSEKLQPQITASKVQINPVTRQTTCPTPTDPKTPICKSTHSVWEWLHCEFKATQCIFSSYISFGWIDCCLTLYPQFPPFDWSNFTYLDFHHEQPCEPNCEECPPNDVIPSLLVARLPPLFCNFAFPVPKLRSYHIAYQGSRWCVRKCLWARNQPKLFSPLRWFCLFWPLWC